MVLALLAGAGWWWVRAPAIVHAAAPSVPDIDIDVPAVRAQRQAAIAVATMPDDPWTLAESLAASAPARPHEDAKENCGIADAPQFANTGSTEQEPAFIRGAMPRYLAAQARIDAALRSSGDPLDRATADFVNAGDLRTEAGADAAVTQQAAVSNDPRVVSLGHAVCERTPTLPGCAALTAQRWAQVDAGNGMPWIELLAQARARGDAAGMRDAMAHLAASTRFDMRFFAIPGAVIRALPEDQADLAAGNDLVTRAFGRGAALPFPAFRALLDSCRNDAGGDEQRAQECVQVSDAMYAHSDTLLTYVISGHLLLVTKGDASRRDANRVEVAALTAQRASVSGLSPCASMRDEIRKMARSADIGEVAAMREQSRKSAAP